MEPGPHSAYSPKPGRSSQPRRPQHPIWALIGSILAIALIIGGLAFVGAIVLVVTGMNHFGSNK